eukprot:TRINITY_DN11181_c0_g1_i5.p1 TRINITY_DN11181_c0_g1~~TRINITY_DN11181_c0_g1_i5.p1  ORF type:complete len:341 (+),score=64.87 TRINITY_DN11181_c0_g1_i5:476-1498(+)
MEPHTSKLKSHYKGKWTAEEDEFILNSVALMERPYNWKEMAGKGNERFTWQRRSAQEYSKRWHFLASAEATKEPWSRHEELRLILGHNRYKNRWRDISALLKGRSNNTIKNKFYSIFRKVKGKIKKGDYTYTSKLELLEIYYVISVIEEYLDGDKDYARAKGRRGKDYIWSLIHTVDKRTVSGYKNQLQSLAEHEGTLNGILSQLSTESNIEDIPKAEAKGHIEEAKNTSEIFIKLPDNLFFDEPFIKPLRLLEPDAPMLFEQDFGPTTPPLSPSTLSAGPAATAAGAARAACFTDSFGDVASFVRSIAEEGAGSSEYPTDTHGEQSSLIESDRLLNWIN